jgi:hypothetical protein
VRSGCGRRYGRGYRKGKNKIAITGIFYGETAGVRNDRKIPLLGGVVVHHNTPYLVGIGNPLPILNPAAGFPTHPPSASKITKRVGIHVHPPNLYLKHRRPRIKCDYVCTQNQGCGILYTVS